MIERVTWGDNKSLHIEYADSDRVHALRFGDDTVSFGSEYQYNSAGFRMLGRYDVLKDVGNGEVDLEYDGAGNSIRVEVPGPEGGTRVVEHTIGSENQLLLINPRGAEMFQQPSSTMRMAEQFERFRAVDSARPFSGMTSWAG